MQARFLQHRHLVLVGYCTVYSARREADFVMVRSGFIDVYPVLFKLRHKSQRLLQLRVLRFGFLEDGNVGVGVFP